MARLHNNHSEGDISRIYAANPDLFADRILSAILIQFNLHFPKVHRTRCNFSKL